MRFRCLIIHDLCHGICQKHFIITQQSIQRNKESMLKLPAIAQFLVEIKVRERSMSYGRNIN